ncbi:MAG: hypothetical protein IJJ76_06160 [Ruminococcus sp.]|uniref:hypothetical protein n=1 Tax=Ruminococcus sp. TaxID=41978 RepID=UPI0025E13AAB|nr:hypothetical protein [Ruminococcus sp.]MBR0529338.1 hypothetical protein [Ruminococcus sp.]
MKIQKIFDLVESGREVEFEYDGKKYSITYGTVDDVEVISFCEFYKDSTEVTTADELLKVKRDGVSVEEMLLSLSEDDIWIF